MWHSAASAVEPTRRVYGPPFGGVLTTHPEPRLVRLKARMVPIKLRLLAGTAMQEPGSHVMAPS